MSYAITYRGIDGQSGLYARVQRTADGKWWNESSSLWQDSEAANCNITLTEGSTPGEYTGSGGLNPVNGHVYAISVYDGAGSLLITTYEVYKTGQKTALEMINAVQKELRLPQSTLMTEPHAQLILGFINAVSDLVMEPGAWHDLGVKGRLMTRSQVGIYGLNPVNVRYVDIVRNLQIGDNPPLEKYTDEEFRAYKRSNTGTGRPVIYRIYGRAGGALLIEMAPTPDAAYGVDFEALQKQEKSSASTDKQLLDEETILRGTLAMARGEQGLSNATDIAAFQAKLELQIENQSESNWGDVEAV